MRQLTFHLNDESHTNVLGAALADVLTPGMKLYLHGDLGTGKTTLARALINKTGHSGPVKSPTYTLVEPYTVRVKGKETPLLHFDLYRMGDPDEFLDAGFREHFDDDTICMVEWAEKADSILPDPDIRISFHVHGLGRRVKLQALTEEGAKSLSHLRFDPDS